MSAKKELQYACWKLEQYSKFIESLELEEDFEYFLETQEDSFYDYNDNDEWNYVSGKL